jgi:hypothetical protein
MDGAAVQTRGKLRLDRKRIRIHTDGTGNLAQTNYCTETEYTSEKGHLIHYDLKPEQYGSMSIGLYADSSCIVEYTSETLSAEEVVRSITGNGGSGLYSLEENLAFWNDAFDVYKQ